MKKSINGAERDGYHNLVTETRSGVTQSVTIFNNLRNLEHVKMLVDGYEFINNAVIRFGKVKSIEKYVAKEYSGIPVRLKISTEFNDHRQRELFSGHTRFKQRDTSNY